MEIITNAEIVILAKELTKIEDPRRTTNTRYPLAEVIFTVLCGLMAGQNSWYLMKVFAELQLNWMREYYPFKHGIASHDTLNRVISLLSAECFEELLSSIGERKLVVEAIHQPTISIDGKGIARSATVKEQQTNHKAGGRTCTLIANAYCHELGMCIGQKSDDNMGKEKKLVEALLDKLSIRNALVIADAGNLSTTIVKKIRAGAADYLLAVKGNNKLTKAYIMNTFAKGGEAIEVNEMEEKNRGRTEKRTCCVLPVKKTDTIATKWEGIQSIVKIERSRTIRDKESKETSFYISSIAANAAVLQYKIRQHWGIENKLHWVLDVIMQEDDCSSRAKNCAGNLAALRRMVLAIYKSIPDERSYKAKMLNFVADAGFRNTVLKYL
ncbi:hypothetical protein C7N43_02735 [Sphingobacteriales bacterium UPWRP_1]|nr:hypothetical protein B6N25_06230 [Sphingobacteriales bacterium TSM_CSS]PSJ78669.1 hypothetical protein C7N43_02735 [Sphingobacteriales bacterium UPWRP_1]